MKYSTFTFEKGDLCWSFSTQQKSHRTLIFDEHEDSLIMTALAERNRVIDQIRNLYSILGSSFLNYKTISSPYWNRLLAITEKNGHAFFYCSFNFLNIFTQHFQYLIKINICAEKPYSDLSWFKYTLDPTLRYLQPIFIFFCYLYPFQSLSLLSGSRFLLLFLLEPPPPVRGGVSLYSSPEPVSTLSMLSTQLSGTAGKSSPSEWMGWPYTLLCRSAMSFRMSAISSSRKSKEPGGPWWDDFRSIRLISL